MADAPRATARRALLIITIRFPLIHRELVRTYRGKPLRVRLRGDEVLQMDSRGMDATFFDPIAR